MEVDSALLAGGFHELSECTCWLADGAFLFRFGPFLCRAFWFLSNSSFFVSEANEQGMHANSLSITRQLLEAISVIELGLSHRRERRLPMMSLLAMLAGFASHRRHRFTRVQP